MKSEMGCSKNTYERYGQNKHISASSLYLVHLVSSKLYLNASKKKKVLDGEKEAGSPKSQVLFSYWTFPEARHELS